MDTMLERAIYARIVAGQRAALVFDRSNRDRGQASTEYAGVLFVVVALVAVVIAAIQADVGTAIKDRIVAAINGVGGGGGAAPAAPPAGG